MTNILMILQIIVLILMVYVMCNAISKPQKNREIIIDRENTKELNNLNRLRQISLSKPLTEKSRPSSFDEVIGQEKGIKALKAALCGPNPQHVIIYGPPGVGKTAAARLVLEEARKSKLSPFTEKSKFVELDATTLRFDERGIADPLIGSVHDPIYQGAGSLGIAGIPQPKAGAVTKAHGGVLFLDEIGELHPIELNKLLKVLEDRKVFLDSSYYSSEDTNMPKYIKEVFDNGLPADFRLIGATTRAPHEIIPAIRSRCVEIFFRALLPEEIEKIAENCVNKVGLQISKDGVEEVSKYCTNGREVINLIQLASGIAINEDRSEITLDDIKWVLENGQYNKIISNKIPSQSRVGVVNGLAVYGANIGMLMPLEVSCKKVTSRRGELKITGIVEEEEITNNNKKIKMKSTAFASVQNVLTVLDNLFDLSTDRYDIHVNISGGIPVDGPSAGISIATAIYSAITKQKINRFVAMTGEISILGSVKAIGGVKAKISAAFKAGAKKVIIPQENYDESLHEICEIEIIPVTNFKEVIKLAIEEDIINESEREILSAEGNNILNNL
ncbi:MULTISPECIES: ATP-dependent protease LonB [Clostridium]|jgi:ATP-dependent protease LonB|uniref:endopeptidase La n=2 Tax=Clostridium beijerinckii TaxID=1520 RepID=A0AAE2RTN7_CLOBE|nr:MULTISPECIES: ATP-dependent protease LonB [Clostridium]ABR33509.1 Sporulation protease LonB [Clostridium beijerinckii NCIMB 8052]AIU01119.1 sporulation protease LonB [Clostridium beijerinckii ATCC 35702]ALB47341.1 ATP-dependent protease LonB [Clostridium beijerinckii NRRL B-598]MBF7811590.1 ATP-dependent protease LonB [Clostridium beijerinckii]NRT25230.1 Lon-like ATP-dependent protease [Clostridium beijerinckii]